MGLDTSHDCWHGAYSAFSRWRDILCRAAGYELVEDKDGPFTYLRVSGLDYDVPVERYYGKGWKKKLPAVAGRDPDPMLLLVLHSDCDGVIKHKHTKVLADRLEELLPALEAIDGGGHIGNAADKTRQFIAGLREAYDEGESVDFH